MLIEVNFIYKKNTRKATVIPIREDIHNALSQ